MDKQIPGHEKTLSQESQKSLLSALEAYKKAQSAFEKAHDFFETSQKSQELGIHNIYEEAIRAAKLIMWEYDIKQRRITMFDDPVTREDCTRFGWPLVWQNVPSSLLSCFEMADISKVLTMYQEVNAGRNAACEAWLKNRPDQEPRCERMIYQVICDKAGHPLKAYGIGQNITAEKKVEERYQREILYLKQNLERNLLAKGRGSLTRNQVLDYTDFSPKAYKLKPSDPTFTAALQDFLQSIHPLEGADQNPRDILNAKYLINSYKLGVFQHRIKYCRCEPGKFPLWVVMQLNVYMSPATGDLECFFYAYDITEERLKEHIINQLFIMRYEELGYLYVRENLYKVLQLDGTPTYSGAYDTALEEHFLSRVIPEEAAALRQKLSLAHIVLELKNSATYSFMVSMLDSAGKLQTKLVQLSYINKKLGIIFFCLSDITKETAEKQKQIQKFKAAKLEADKANQSKSNFLSSMSHDLRTPLNGVIGFTELALQAETREEKQAYLQKIKTSGQLLLDLVNDTLDLSRIESGKLELKLEPVDGKNFWESIVLPLIPTAAMKKVNLATDPAAYPSEMILIDKLKVKKILLNLISNAIKYTPAGGTVKVSITALNKAQCGYTRRLIVEDNGIGMSEEFLQRLYEPFAQEHRPEAANVVGTGLGLSIVKRFIDLMHGSIQVESKLHLGTRFTVDLPLEHWEKKTAAIQAQQEAVYAAAEQETLTGRKLLLCEDNHLNAEIAIHLLNNKHLSVDWVQDGREGLQKFQNSLPYYYDLILMDIRMPNLDGYAATKAIRQLTRPDARTVPILAMTGDAFEEDIRHGREVGMNGYIVKPIIPQLLYQTLVKLLGNQPRLDTSH